MPKSRVQKSILNARVSFIFYILTLACTFFSRTIFLKSLGSNFLGLVGTLQNILGLMNLAELGLGAAISFALYKPLQENRKNAISDIISLFGFFYKKIGAFVFGAAIILSAFFPLIFRNSPISYGVVYSAFYAFLISSLLSYFVNYTQILFVADQKNYLVAAYFQTANILKILLQMALARKYGNPYIWIAVELAFGILYSLILRWKVRRVYPWLKTCTRNGAALKRQYPDILIRTKQVFIHKIKDFLLMQSDQIFVFAFDSLSMVAYYGNYTLITTRITGLFTTTMDSITAGIGNLIAEGNRQKILSVFWELMAFRYFLAGIIVFCCYHLINSFISLWLGSEYILENSIVVLLMIYVFIMITRGTVDMFNTAFGLYADTWSAWTEVILNVGITLSTAFYLGINGILLGKIISTSLIIALWKPYYLFSRGLRASYLLYWKKTFPLLLAFAISYAAFHFISKPFLTLFPGHSSSFGSWLSYAVCLCAPFSVCYGILLLCISQGARDLLRRLPSQLRPSGATKKT